MFTFHKPKVFRSANGCCICKAKSSSSRFTDSKRYEAYFEKCFSLEELRSGEICNACVLLVKRFIKLPAGSTRHWNHVVDARSGPGIKSMVKSKKAKADTSNTKDENDTPEKEKINKKHFYRSKVNRKPVIVRKRNPSIQPSGFLDMNRWTKEQVCCGIIFRGPHGEVAIDPRFLKPCTTCKSMKEPLLPLATSNNNNNSTCSKIKQTVDLQAADIEEMDSDDSASDHSSGPSDETATSPLSALVSAASSKLIDEGDDEGFFDKAVVSPSESGSSTPPPTSDPETQEHEEESRLFSHPLLNAT
jgi:hypothetical protein